MDALSCKQILQNGPSVPSASSFFICTLSTAKKDCGVNDATVIRQLPAAAAAASQKSQPFISSLLFDCTPCLSSLFTSPYLLWPGHNRTLVCRTSLPKTTTECNENPVVRMKMSTERSACSLEHQTGGSGLLLSYWMALC